jgi:hypothetical protein
MGKKKGKAVAREPEVSIRVRNSERGTMDKCPQRWWWSWRDGLRPKETAKALWFGTGIHLALAHYYAPGIKRRKDFIDVWRAYADEEANYMRVKIGGIDEDMFIEARALGESMLTQYVVEYNHDKNWDVIATEQSFELRVPYRFDGLHPLIAEQLTARFGDAFFLNGTFDGVYRDKRDKRIKLMEHKTAASISVGHLPMDNQAGTYWMVAQAVGRKQGWLASRENISEITYNFLRKALPDPRPRDDKGYCLNKPSKQAYIDALDSLVEWPTTSRGTIKYPTVEVLEEMADEHGIVVLGERSKSQPPPLFERHGIKRTPAQRVMQLYRLQAEVNKMLMLREGILDITKSPSRDTCPMCPYREMCELHESGSDWEGYRDSMFRSDDPYADHRKDAGVGAA